MKKLLVVILTFAFSFMAMCNAVAEGKKPEVYTSGNWSYQIQDDGSIKITRFSGIEYPDSFPVSLDEKDVTAIAENVFGWDSKLKKISIPECVLFVEGNPFGRCWEFESIIVSPDHPTLAVKDGVLYSKNDKRLICCPALLFSDSFEIPNGVTIIGDDSFMLCSNIKNINIPNTVTYIGNYAFGSCWELTELVIPNSVTTIGDYAFMSCNELLSVTLPESVVNIGNDIFQGCDKLLVTVVRDSYAAQYCKENKVNYQYIDSDDWLNE